ncbi:MAG: hypothetical protein ACRDLP_15010 [Solirubrobacteraceae bacterium]
MAATALIGACGGANKSPGVANVRTTTTGSTSTATTTPSGALGGNPGPSSSGGSPGSGAHSSFAIVGGSRQNALKFSACMRANGEPSFPDPNANGVIQGQNIDPGSPQFQAAQKKCRRYAPNGGKAPSPAQQQQLYAHALRFAQCMRAHGEPQFPDPPAPSGSGGVGFSIHGKPGSALDPRSPIFQHAQKACGSLLPGRNGPVTSSGSA